MNYRRLHYSRTHEFIAFLSRQCGNLTYTCRHGLIKGMRRKGGLGFLPEFLANSETSESIFLRSLDLRDKIVYDIGVFEGLLTLFFARQAKQVISYEPNPRSFARASENVALNSLRNVSLRNLALGNETGELRLTYDSLMPGAASGDQSVRQQIEDSTKQTSTFFVRVARLDDDIAQNSLPAPDFVKIDVEGMELAVLRGAEETLARRPSVYLELHGTDIDSKRENARAVLEFLSSAGYRSFYDVERGALTSPETADRPSHIYASYQPLAPLVE